MLFLIFLSLSGIALNHTTGLGLDQRTIVWPQLLQWYGLEMPEIAASYRIVDGSGAATAHVTLVGQRLFINDLPALGGIDHLAGAIGTADGILAATDWELQLYSERAELLDRLSLRQRLPMPVESLGFDTELGYVAIRSAETVFYHDDTTFEQVGIAAAGALIDWAPQEPLPAELTEEIATQYRGGGITVERLLYDLHSGRILSRAGQFFMDVIGVVLILLGVSGLIIWMRPRF